MVYNYSIKARFGYSKAKCLWEGTSSYIVWISLPFNALVAVLQLCMILHNPK